VAVALSRVTHVRSMTRLLRVQAFAALSQATGALQLAALLVAVGPGRPTDAYIILFTASQMPVAALIIGTLQPTILSRPGYRGWGRWTVAGVAVTVPLVWLVAAFLLANGYRPGDVVPVAALVTVSASIAVAASVHAVHAAASGRPEILAGLTALPNACAALLVLVPGPNAIPLMCAGLLVGNVATFRIADAVTRSTAGRPADERRDSGSADGVAGSSTGGLLMSSTVGATGPFALQAVTATYAAGQATLLGFASKVGSGFIGVGVTSFTNVATDWHRRSVRPLQMAVRWFTAGQVTLLLWLGCLLLANGFQTVKTSLAAGAWVLAAASQACSGRALSMLGRLAVFRKGAVAGVFLYGAATIGLIEGPHSALSYFLALMIIATSANLIFLYGLDWRREYVTYVISLLVPIGLGAAALIVHNA
jgi:hypothetical protein